MQAEPLDFVTRIWFAWMCFFRVLFDASFAGRAWLVRERLPELEAGPSGADLEQAREEAREEARREAEARAERRATEAAAARDDDRQADREAGALMMLSLLQRDGRFVDFVQQDVAKFDDAEIGAAARVVHEGCRKALRGHVSVAPVRAEPEGAKVTIEEADLPMVKLVGDVRGSAPFEGTLRHKGWQAAKVTLPVPTKGHDPALLGAAEVEL